MPKSYKKTRSKRNKTTLKVGGFWPFSAQDNTNQAPNNTNQAPNNTNQAPNNTNQAPNNTNQEQDNSWSSWINKLIGQKPKNGNITQGQGLTTTTNLLQKGNQQQYNQQQQNGNQPQNKGYIGGKTRRNRKSSKHK